MSEYASRADLAAKVEWEGGVSEALEYGIKAEDMPDDDMRAVWERLERAWDSFRDAAEEAETMLGMEP